MVYRLTPARRSETPRPVPTATKAMDMHVKFSGARCAARCRVDIASLGQSITVQERQRQNWRYHTTIEVRIDPKDSYAPRTSPPPYYVCGRVC